VQKKKKKFLEIFRNYFKNYAPKSFILQFLITPTSHQFNKGFGDAFDIKSKELWENLKTVLLENIPNSTVSLLSWKLGCIIINTHISKIFGGKWTKEELHEIDIKLPGICEQFKKIHQGLNCGCKD